MFRNIVFHLLYEMYIFVKSNHRISFMIFFSPYVRLPCDEIFTFMFYEWILAIPLCIFTLLGRRIGMLPSVFGDRPCVDRTVAMKAIGAVLLLFFISASDGKFLIK